jgi:F0F1-type ATP synthase alpha subunit
MLQLDKKASTVAGNQNRKKKAMKKHTIIVAANTSVSSDASLCSFRRCSSGEYFAVGRPAFDVL